MTDDKQRAAAWDAALEGQANVLLQSALTLKATAIAADCMISIRASFNLSTAIAVAERAVLEMRDIQAKKGVGHQ